MRLLAAIVLALALPACTVTVELGDPGPDAGPVDVDASWQNDGDVVAGDAGLADDATIDDSPDAL